MARSFSLGIRCNGDELTEILYLPGRLQQAAGTPLAAEAVRQIQAYLADPAFVFSLPLQPSGTRFQRRVWDAIAAIPRGQTQSYGEVAKLLHSGPRAVGGACGANPFPPGGALPPGCRRCRPGRFRPQRRRLSAGHQALAAATRGLPAGVNSVPMTDAAPPTLAFSTQSEIDAFCDALWLEDGLSPNSLAAYRSDLQRYALWLQQQGRPPLAQAGAADLAAFLADVAARMKSSSQARYLSSLRRFYRRLLAQNRISADPTLQTAMPVKSSRLPKVMSEAQVEALLAAPEIETPLGQRDRAMLETLYATGLRVSELVNLKLHEVSFDMGVGPGSSARAPRNAWCPSARWPWTGSRAT